MRFTSSTLLSALVATATLINATPAAMSAAAVASAAAISNIHTTDTLLRKADDAVIAQVWTNANKGGQQKDISADKLPLACQDFAPPFQDSISSLSVNDGVICTFFRDFRCGGPSFTVRNLYVANLTAPFDNEISAVSCKAP